MKLIYVLFCGILAIPNLFSQTFLTNKVEIDPNRYSDISGSPYYFDEATKAELYLNGESDPYQVSLNINLHENEIEVYQGNSYSVVGTKAIEKIIVPGEYPITIVNIAGKLMFKIFESETQTLFQNTKMTLETREHRPPGEIIIKKKFKRSDTYQLKREDGLHFFELNKKSIAKNLGKEAEKKVKSTKNKLKSNEDLIILIASLDN